MPKQLRIIPQHLIAFSGCVPIRYKHAEIYRRLGHADRAADDLTYIIVHADRTKGKGQWLVLLYLNRGLARIECGDLEQGFIDFVKARESRWICKRAWR